MALFWALHYSSDRCRCFALKKLTANKFQVFAPAKLATMTVFHCCIVAAHLPFLGIPVNLRYFTTSTKAAKWWWQTCFLGRNIESRICRYTCAIWRKVVAKTQHFSSHTQSRHLEIDLKDKQCDHILQLAYTTSLHYPHQLIFFWKNRVVSWQLLFRRAFTQKWP